MMDYFQILCSLILVFLSIYYYYTSNNDFWKKHNIPGPTPTFFFGNLKEMAFQQLSKTDCLKKLYDEYKHEPVFGIFQGKTPTLMVTDLNLIKDILIKDFTIFSTRGLNYYKRAEPLQEHMFFLNVNRWRPLRPQFSPIFSTGKLKEMMPLMIKCSEHLEEYLNTNVGDGGFVECRELATKYTTDVTGNCIFGIEMNALKNDKSEFREMGRRIFVPTKQMIVREIMKQFLPSLYSLIGNILQPEGVNDFYIKAMLDIFNYRKNNDMLRSDFMNALVQLQRHPEKMKTLDMSDQLLITQGFVFFVAGFENTGLTMSHALYELAQNHEIQNKLRKEILDECKKHGKTFTYDQMRDLPYLDKVFKETLRKYPVLPFLSRKATEKYTFKGTNIMIPKDTIVWLPTYAIQRDPDIYSDPDKFDPERFSDEAVAARHPMAYLPFGDGPRNCIGVRFTNYQVKVGIATVVRDYKLDVCEATTIPYKHEKRSVMLMMKGINLKLTKIKN